MSGETERLKVEIFCLRSRLEKTEAALEEARKWIPVACGPKQVVRVNLRLDEILSGDDKEE